MKCQKTTQNRIKYKALTVMLYTTLMFVGILALFSAIWYTDIFGDVGFESIIFSLAAGFAGVSGGIVTNWLLRGFLPTLAVTALFSVGLFWLLPKILDKKEKIKVNLVKSISFFIAFAVFFSFFISACEQTHASAWVINLVRQGDLYETQYKSPDDTKITFPEKKRNLIYIYLESMETGFFSREQGGAQDDCVIPELYDLASENLNFSHTDSVGGGRDTYGTNWTIAAMLSQTAGINLKSPVSLKAITSRNFYDSTVSINDILNDNGYNQAVMVGSKSSYGGRKEYFLQHGIDKVYDIDTAYEDNIVPEGYFEWWGMEDKYLFEYAKQKICELSQKDEPFNFTMLTVDTHHVAGYKCSECENEYPEQYQNVLRCSSKQVGRFVSWLKTQPFYENTTIIITGDHETMDNGYITRNFDKNYTRRIYNCFINSAVEPKKEKGREFVTLDMFPTTLASLGCTIDGDRLGLGTNLFSSKQTLTEIYGYEKLNDELAKSSKIYNSKFD